MSQSYLQLKVVEVTRETAEAVTIHFEHPEKVKIASKAGQFLTLILPINGKEVRRSYSLSSAPHEAPRLAVTVKKVPNGLVSNYLVDNCTVGMEMKVLEPMGNFKIETDPANARHIVLVGAGSGITPLISMAKAVLLEEAKSRVTLIYGNRHEGTIIFKDKLNEMQARYGDRLVVEHVFSQPKADLNESKLLGLKSIASWFKKKEDTPAESTTTQHKYKGRLNRKMLIQILERQHLTDYLDTEFYLCGPSGMMEEAKEAFKILNILPERIHKESFITAKEKEQVADAIVTTADGIGDNADCHVVTVIYEGAEYKIPVQKNQTILEAGLALDIDLPYSCQAGLCTACRGKCLSGKVHLDEQDGLSETEIEKGYVLNCVGHPLTADVVIEVG